MLFRRIFPSGAVKYFTFIGPFILLLMWGYFANAQKNPNWRVVCEQTQGGKICAIQQQLHLQKEIDGKKQTVGRLVSAVVQKVKANKGGYRHVMNLLLPLGTNLKAGIKIIVDKGPEYSFPYSRCTAQGCLVIIPVSKKIINSLKRGKNLRIAFLPFGDPKTMVVNIKLAGFTKQLNQLR